MNEVQKNFKRQIGEIEKRKKQRSETMTAYNGDKITYYFDEKGRVIDKQITNESKHLYFKPKAKINTRLTIKLIVLAIVIIAAVIIHSIPINGHHYFFFFMP